jgi:hypothetical membrane protein
MTNKHYSFIGFSAFILFLTTYLIMSNLRPEYSFLYKQISELGSLDAPNKSFWNVFGYIIPGLLLSVYSFGLYKNISNGQGGKLPLIGFVLSPLLMSFSGVFPADMDNRQSLTTLLHMVGSYGSYLFFLIGAFTYPKLMRKSNYWKKAVTPTLFFVWMTILFGGWHYVFPHIPSVGQRIVFSFYFLWFLYTAKLLCKMPKNI